MQASDLVAIFDHCFERSEATVLRGGADEPLYTPWGEGGAPAVIHFRCDYAASALHEVAHWCIAGRSRRRLIDFGYWYRPDGRSGDEQAAFVAVEARPQALESLFHAACGSVFHLSLDNLDGDPGDAAVFAQAVDRERTRLERDGLPPRGERFRRALLRARGGIGRR